MEIAAEGFAHFTSAADWGAKGNNSEGVNIAWAPAIGRGGRGGCSVGLNANFHKVLGAAETTIYHHYAVKSGARGNACQFAEYRSATNTHIIVQGLQDGSIQVLRTGLPYSTAAFLTTGSTQLGITGPNVWSSATDHQIQTKVTIHASSGEVTIKVDGIQVLSIIDNTYAGSGALTITQVGHGCNTDSGTPIIYSDFVVNNPSGSLNNTFGGDLAVRESVAPVDGDELQWTRSTGAGTWASHVDQNPQTVDAIYLRSTVNGNRNCFTFPAVSSATIGTIVAVKETVCLRKEDASYGAVQLFGRGPDDVDHDGAIQTVTQSYCFRERIFETYPQDDTAWSDTKVNGTQLGSVNVS